jgi:hypothetical protein
MKKHVVTRRDFLKTTSSAALAGAFFLTSPERALGRRPDDQTGDDAGEKSGGKARVVLIRDAGVMDASGNVDANVLQGMLDTAVAALFQEDHPTKAWRRIVKKEDIVGIKSNEWRYLPTPEALEAAIKGRVMEAGVPEANISVRDRGILDDEVFQKATALINVRPLRTHHWSGVGTLLKNYIMFTRTPWDHHDDSCADLAKLWKLPMVDGKTRLNILVMLTPQFHGVGPHNFAPEYTWPYKGLIVGLDPVAVDSTGVRILIARRKEHFKEDRPLNPPPKHVFLADTRHHLGTADPDKIELVKIGWEEGILI